MPQIYKGSKELKLSEIIKGDNPPLAVLRNVNEELLDENIDAMFIILAKVFKLAENKTFSDMEIYEATELLKTQYYFLKWDDLLLFVQNVKLGRYNDIYNRWDMPTFFSMLDRYCDERTNTATTINQVKAIEQKREALSEDTLKMIQAFKDKNESDRRARYQVAEAKEMGEAQKLHNEWIADFKKEVGTLAGFITIGEKKLNINEYLEYRNAETY